MQTLLFVSVTHARFHILRCCLGTLSVVPTLQKLHDFTYCAATLEPYQISCSHAAEIAGFHILRCCLGTLSVVPTLQKLHDFAYCAAALKPYQLFPRCRNWTISHIALLPWNPISCSHAAEISRFHILRCCLGTLSVVPTLQKL